jgi:Ca2+-binding EF-hand superfamily protein
MGCHSTSEAYKFKIINLSKLTEQQALYLIEQIKVSTNLNEKDIYHLMKKFYQLDPNEEGLLSNSQLLEFPQFKYSPFRKHLLRVFKLNTSEDDLPQQADNIEVDLDNNNQILEQPKEKNLIFTEEEEDQEREDSEISKMKDARMIDFSNRNKLAMKDENNINRETRNNYISSLDNSKQRKNSYVNIPVTLGIQYITFQKFCEIMKVFHHRCEVDDKIKCMI